MWRQITSIRMSLLLIDQLILIWYCLKWCDISLMPLTEESKLTHNLDMSMMHLWRGIGFTSLGLLIYSIYFLIIQFIWRIQYIFWFSTWLQEESNDSDSSFGVLGQLIWFWIVPLRRETLRRSLWQVLAKPLIVLPMTNKSRVNYRIMMSVRQSLKIPFDL